MSAKVHIENQRFRNMAVACAFLVVAIHVGKADAVGTSAWWCYKLFGGGIASCAVPFFFLASGYFAAKHFGKDGYWGDALKKRIGSLLIPFVAWSAIFFVEVFLLRGVQNLMHGSSFFNNGLLAHHSFMQAVGLDPYAMPALFPLWFVRSLLVIFVALPLFELFSRSGILCAVWVGALFAAVLVTRRMEGDWNGFFRFTMSLEGAMYFLLGAFLRRRNLARTPPRCVAWACGLVAVAGVLGFAWAKAGGCDVPMWLSLLLTPVEMLWLWSIVPDKTWPSWLTGNAFSLFLLHVPMLAVLNVLVVWIGRYAGNDISDSAVTSICEWVVACGLSLAVAEGLCRLCPAAAKVLFGGRVARKN